MARRVLKLQLAEETHARLTAAAAQEGLSLEAWARRRLEDAARTDSAGVRETSAAFDTQHDWAEADRRLADYDRTGEFIDAEAWMTELRAAVRARQTG